MAFTAEQNEKIKQTFLDKVKMPCPGCGQKNWYLADNLLLLNLEIDAGKGETGKALPLVTATCNVCGNTQFYNVISWGVADALRVKLK
jgi:predicted nucleic-acid-binding Zn-ribbon protein